MENLIKLITDAYEHRSDITPDNLDAPTRQAILSAIDLMDIGEIRVANKVDGEWVINEWLKKAILLYFRISVNTPIDGQFTQFYDKLPLKYADDKVHELKAHGVRIVPPACIRKGAHIEPNTVLMPSYVNIGAYIDSGVMVDTWATVGSCAQIGKNVHLSGGVGIGGVLEPLQAAPTIIEDNCFIGARSEVVEGVIVEHGAVISMGVYIGQSTKIYDREADTVTYGRIPAGAVVVPGTLPSTCGKYHLYAAIIVKRVDDKTWAKVGINELLRNVD